MGRGVGVVFNITCISAIFSLTIGTHNKHDTKTTTRLLFCITLFSFLCKLFCGPWEKCVMVKPNAPRHCVWLGWMTLCTVTHSSTTWALNDGKRGILKWKLKKYNMLLSGFFICPHIYKISRQLFIILTDMPRWLF